MYEEEVNGTIIGGDPPGYFGRLFCDGRPQGIPFHADTKDELREKAAERKCELLAQCGKAAHLIYPHDTWELRIYP